MIPERIGLASERDWLVHGRYRVGASVAERIIPVLDAKSDAELARLVLRYPEIPKNRDGLSPAEMVHMADLFQETVLQHPAVGEESFRALVERFPKSFNLARHFGQLTPQAWALDEVRDFARDWSNPGSLNLEFLRFYAAERTGVAWERDFRRLLEWRPLEAARLLADTEPSPLRPVSREEVQQLLENPDAEVRRWALVALRHVSPMGGVQQAEAQGADKVQERPGRRRP